LNDFIMGLLEGMCYAMALLNKHLPKDEKGPAIDAISEIDDEIARILYGSTIRGLPDKLALLPRELTVEDAVKPGDTAGPGDISVEVAPHEKAIRIEVEGKLYDHLMETAQARGISLEDLFTHFVLGDYEEASA